MSTQPIVEHKSPCQKWLEAADVTNPTANKLIQAESGCNPWAINKKSGACGVAQELPCGKSGCIIGDGQCQVAWMEVYVLRRYGSWENAWAWWQRTDPRPFP